MIRRLLKGVIAQRDNERRDELLRKLIRHEAKIGGSLFGPVPAGHRREFFCLNEHTWVWHEEWLNDQGEKRQRTTRYEVRPGSVLKSQGGHYQQMDLTEARRLYKAVGLYQERVARELYGSIA